MWPHSWGHDFKEAEKAGRQGRRVCKAPFLSAERSVGNCRERWLRVKVIALGCGLFSDHGRCTCEAKDRRPEQRRSGCSVSGSKIDSCCDSRRALPGTRGRLQGHSQMHNNAHWVQANTPTQKNKPRRTQRGLESILFSYLAVSGDGPQLPRQEVVGRPRSANNKLAILELLRGGVVAVLILLN
jgi:hypothetical protein